jgi:hypothetical protein
VEPLDPEDDPELAPELIAPESDEPPDVPELVPGLPDPELLVLDPDPELEPVLDEALCAVPPPEEEEQPPSMRVTADHTVNGARTRMVPTVPPAGHRQHGWLARFDLPCGPRSNRAMGLVVASQLALLLGPTFPDAGAAVPDGELEGRPTRPALPSNRINARRS